MPVRCSMPSTSVIPADYIFLLIECCAEFQNPVAAVLYTHGPGQSSGSIEQQNHAVVLTLSGAAGQREPHGMEQLLAAASGAFFERGDDFFVAIGIDGRGIE